MPDTPATDTPGEAPKAERITLTCADGVQLQGHFALASGGTPGLPVLLSPATVADLLRTFPATHKQALRIKPASHGLKAIGHIDWFRATHQALWPMIATSLRGQQV